MSEFSPPTAAELAVPLSQEQVDAANRLHQHLPGWQRFDLVLHSLAERFPSNTCIIDVIPKAVTLNRLYGTNILAITAMADRIVEVLAGNSSPHGLEIVEQMAWLRGLGPKERDIRFLSFASKYCHFFLDSDRFPVLDGFAGRALTHHLGRRHRPVIRRHPSDYPRYVEAVNRLRSVAGLRGTYAEVDHYLWLCGQWLDFGDGRESGKPGPINPEVWETYLHPPDASVHGLIGAAFGSR